jgi:hypothetical protein
MLVWQDNPEKRFEHLFRNLARECTDARKSKAANSLHSRLQRHCDDTVHETRIMCQILKKFGKV